MKKIAAIRNFVFNMTECDGVASSTTAVSLLARNVNQNVLN